DGSSIAKSATRHFSIPGGGEFMATLQRNLKLEHQSGADNWMLSTEIMDVIPTTVGFETKTFRLVVEYSHWANRDRPATYPSIRYSDCKPASFGKTTSTMLVRLRPNRAE
ncbi:hypothetical protein CLF_113278, partial [Clonorchis sinensis]